jgi:hypothetical protein
MEQPYTVFTLKKYIYIGGITSRVLSFNVSKMFQFIDINHSIMLKSENKDTHVLLKIPHQIYIILLRRKAYHQYIVCVLLCLEVTIQIKSFNTVTYITFIRCITSMHVF